MSLRCITGAEQRDETEAKAGAESPRRLASEKAQAAKGLAGFVSVAAAPAAAEPENRNQPGPSWSCDELYGRLVEVSGAYASSALTCAVHLSLEAQRQGELVVWVLQKESSFYPPDVSECGVDLDSLVVVRVGEQKSVARAASKLLTSGAFALVVLDLGADSGRGAAVPTPLQGRLTKLAQKHHSAVVCLTEKKESLPSIGSMVSLRTEATRIKLAGGRFGYRVRALKDKKNGPHWQQSEVARGPSGLR